MALTIIAFILIIAFLVLVHELGHFFAAKKAGMDIEEFGLGFPPTLLKKTINGTKYALNLIPLGGYVTIKGQDGDKLDDPGSFGSKPVWKRIIVILAGVSMNIIAGWLIFIALFAVSAPVEIDETIPKKYILEQNIVISEIIEDSPAQIAGLEPGDEIITINSAQALSIDMFQNTVKDAQDNEVKVSINRFGKQKDLLIKPVIMPDIAPDRHVIGIALVNMGTVRYPIHLAAVAGSEAAYGYITRIGMAFAKIIKGAFIGEGLKGIGGPVAIVVATNDMLDLGFARVLIFTAILSFNLVILNILPFPALDGGRLIFLAVEAIRGKPSKQEVEAWFHRIGFLLLILLAIFITYRDIARFGGRIWSRVVG